MKKRPGNYTMLVVINVEDKRKRGSLGGDVEDAGERAAGREECTKTSFSSIANPPHCAMILCPTVQVPSVQGIAVSTGRSLFTNALCVLKRDREILCKINSWH